MIRRLAIYKPAKFTVKCLEPRSCEMAVTLDINFDIISRPHRYVFRKKMVAKLENTTDRPVCPERFDKDTESMMTVWPVEAESEVLGGICW